MNLRTSLLLPRNKFITSVNLKKLPVFAIRSFFLFCRYYVLIQIKIIDIGEMVTLLMPESERFFKYFLQLLYTLDFLFFDHLSLLNHTAFFFDHIEIYP